MREFFNVLREVKTNILLTDKNVNPKIKEIAKNVLKKYKNEEKYEKKDLILKYINDEYQNYLKESKQKNNIDEEFIIELTDIFNHNWNENYNKLRKFKIIYFFYAGNIYLNNIYNKKSNFFVKDPLFWAFKNGPVLAKIGNNEIYNFAGEDGTIYIKYDDWNQKIKDIFQTTVSYFNKLTTLNLIHQSHKTRPWFSNYSDGSYKKEIKNEEIIEYFKDNKPFYFE